MKSWNPDWPWLGWSPHSPRSAKRSSASPDRCRRPPSSGNTATGSWPRTWRWWSAPPRARSLRCRSSRPDILDTAASSLRRGGHDRVTRTGYPAKGLVRGIGVTVHAEGPPAGCGSHLHCDHRRSWRRCRCQGWCWGRRRRWAAAGRAVADKREIMGRRVTAVAGRDDLAISLDGDGAGLIL